MKLEQRYSDEYSNLHSFSFIQIETGSQSHKSVHECFIRTSTRLLHRSGQRKFALSSF